MSFGNVILNAYGGADLFIAKYDQCGLLIWAKSFGSIFQAGSIFINFSQMNSVK